MSTELFIARRIYRGDKQNDKRVSSPPYIAISGITGTRSDARIGLYHRRFKSTCQGGGFGSHIRSPPSTTTTPLSRLHRLLRHAGAIAHLNLHLSPGVHLKPGIIKTERLLGVILKESQNI